MDDNNLYIELNCGGSKKAGMDILPFKFYGEGKNLVDPRDAVRLAVDIYESWNLVYHDEKKMLKIVSDDKIQLFDFDKKGIAAATRWAEKIFERMKKCGFCDKPMLNKTLVEHEGLFNLVFCSEDCCYRKYTHIYGNAPAKVIQKKK